jgi:hypothetical protein
MTASSRTPQAPTRRGPSLIPDAYTTAGAVLAFGCTFVGTYVQTPWKSGSDGWAYTFGDGAGWGTLAVLAAIVVVAAFVVGLATARGRAATDPSRTARLALLLAVLGAMTILVFWTGLPAVLAGGATGLAVDARGRLGWLPVPAVTAVVLAGLTAAAAIYLALAG